MASIGALGQYLRARRELLQPVDVALPTVGRRRVPGLRREELAMLAGISADYYLRLEQGRDHHPSPSVIDALARALKLDEQAAAHLRALAFSPAPRSQPIEPECAPPFVSELIMNWKTTPAFIQGRRMDVLASNALASALSPIYTPGVNLVRAAFLDPQVRNLYVDWEATVQSAVAGLRALTGPEIDDPRLAELVGELSVRSDLFRRLWARHDIQVKADAARIFNHPIVGRLELHPEKLQIAGTEGILVVVYHPDVGSPSERALARLAALRSFDPSA
jgi:transcriptional regulator with XRE-family HTH domain